VYQSTSRGAPRMEARRDAPATGRIIMGDDEFILYIRKQYPECTEANPRLGRLIWERLRSLDPTAEKSPERPVACYWGDSGAFIGDQ
jgi:hypothetical protein